MIQATDPLTAWNLWFADALASEPDVPEAMQLATVDDDGHPAQRTVLLKQWDARGLVFYTNNHSSKGVHIAARPWVSALFHWKSLQRQVIIAGPVTPVADAEADAYFASRPRGSQLGAWASLQSQALPDRATLDARVAAYTERFDGGPVPRPPHWSGWRIRPERVELWQGRADRLHERLVFRRQGDDWATETLYP